jgi:hypothetical protein
MIHAQLLITKYDNGIIWPIIPSYPKHKDDDRGIILPVHQLKIKTSSTKSGSENRQELRRRDNHNSK